MIVEDVQVMPNSLSQIFQNPEQRKRILKIIIQTLYNLGYEQSAAELQAESKITYFTPQVKAIRKALFEENYESIQQILQQTKKFELVKDVVNQLKCFKLIKDGKVEQALTLIQNQIKQTEKQAQLSEELMMGTGQINETVLKKKHQYILQKCFDIDILPNSMLKMIGSYIQLQKKGLTNGISPEFSLLRKPLTSRKPPMRIIQNYTSVNIKNISFIKFNRNQTKFLVVSSAKKQKNLTIWNLNKQKQRINQLKSCSFSINQQVVNVSWNYEETELIAVATYNYICIFNTDLKILHKKKINNGVHHSNKILCLNWNILTNFLYVGGAFQSVKIFGSSLEQILTIQPFIRTRNLYFNSEGTIMFAVSATKGIFIAYNLFESKQQSQFITQDIITSFRLENKGKNIIVVTQRKILYLEVALKKQNPFRILYTFDHKFGENGLYEIQGCLFYPWIVILGPCFQALGIDKESGKQNKWLSQNSFTFDIVEGFMVSGSKQLILWASGSQSIQAQNQGMDLEQNIKENQMADNNQEEQEQDIQQQGDSSDIEEQQLDQF